jgi:hypothetical protein
MGAGSLQSLRTAYATIETGPRAVARFHPAIDVRAAGDLLTRAGFTMPVAESETISAQYRDPRRLFTDLRANGCSNVLAERFPLTRAAFLDLISALPVDQEGRTVETFALIMLTGWRAASPIS